MTITLELSGARIVQGSKSPAAGDTIKENDLASSVHSRATVLVLHVAVGRRSMSARSDNAEDDSSIDLVASSFGYTMSGVPRPRT